jgi:hypothetical protein
MLIFFFQIENLQLKNKILCLEQINLNFHTRNFKIEINFLSFKR